MIVIRRMVDRRRAYTAILLKGEPPKIFPTSDAEHARILQVYKQDRPHEGILNDFTDDFPAPDSRASAPAPWPVGAPAPKPRKKAAAKKTARPPAPAPASPKLWLATTVAAATAKP